MSPEEQRIAIAEACGGSDRWVIMKRGYYYRPNAAGYTSSIAEAWIVSEEVADKHTYPHDEPVTKHRAPLPDYLNDLNAMHEAEKVLTEENWGDYTSILEWLMGIDQKSERYRKLKLIHATAQQRAEAFLRAIGKWTDSPLATGHSSLITPTTSQNP